MQILAISGSLRRDSHNTRLLRAAAQMLPPGAELELFDGLAAVPPYNEDDDVEPAPEAVQRLRDAIADSDALLIATPEYNASIPGVLKNAIDWASRAPDQPFADKPVAIMGASPGLLGTARMQYHLRQCLVFLDARVLNKPEVMIGGRRRSSMPRAT